MDTPVLVKSLKSLISFITALRIEILTLKNNPLRGWRWALGFAIQPQSDYNLYYEQIYSPVAQLVEQVAVNHLVAGSSPARGANLFNYLDSFLKVNSRSYLQIACTQISDT